MSARGGDTQGVASASSNVAGVSDARAAGFGFDDVSKEFQEFYALLRNGKEPQDPRHRQAGPSRSSDARSPSYAPHPSPPEAPLEAAGSSDRHAASRSRSPRAPRGVATGIWFDALYAAQQKLAEKSIEAALGIRDGFYASQSRLLRRAEQIMETWKENKEARRSWRTRSRGRITFD